MHTHAHTSTHTHSLRQQARIRRHKNKFIDWYRLRRASSVLPSCSPADAACCVLPLPAASEQKNRQNNNGYTHIHTYMHTRTTIDAWRLTFHKRHAPPSRQESKAQQMRRVLFASTLQQASLAPWPITSFFSLPATRCWDSYRYRWSQCQLQLLPPRATDDFRFRCYCWRHSHCLRADGEESQLKCSCKYPGGGVARRRRRGGAAIERFDAKLRRFACCEQNK